MGSFTNTFGGSAVSPADVAFAAIGLSANTQFYWPAFAAGNPNVLARFMNVQTGIPSINMQMPDASLVSVGADTIISNIGSNALNVVDFMGNAIATILPGTAWYVQVVGNSTQAGLWATIQFGAGTSQAQAASLAGAGLMAVAGLLNLDLDATYVNAAFNITTGSLSELFVWNGGSGIGTLPLAATAGNGFFFMAANAGTGGLTLATTSPDLIDGATTSVFNPLQSGFIISTGSEWRTVGKGTQTNYIYSLLNLNVAGNSDVTLNATQAQNVFQTYTGLLTGNINIVEPAIVQLLIVNNQTTGAFSLNIKTPLGTGQIVPQGQTSILYCDGTNVLSAFSFVPSGSQSFPAGSATAPSLNYAGQLNTGFYFNSGFVGVTVAGTEVAGFSAPPSAVNQLQLNASITTQPVSLQAFGTDGNIDLDVIPKGTGAVVAGGINGLVVPSGTTAQRVGTVGTVRYNTSGPQLEAFVNGNWSPIMLGINNLEDLQSAASARTNLGLGTAALATTGTSGATLGFLNGTNTWSGTQNLTGATVNVTTQGSSTNNTLVASCAFVQSAITAGSGPAIGGPNTWSGTQNFTGATTTVATQASSDNSTKAASTAMVQAALAALAIGGGAVQAFTTPGSATYTPTHGMLFCVVEMVGGGGGGGGVGTGNLCLAAGGGAAGAYSRAIFSAATIGASVSLTIGAAGTAGANTGGTGGTGGTSVFGALITGVAGGVGGGGANTGDGHGGAGIGGTAGTGGIINISGNSGGVGYPGASNIAMSGNGANSPFGAGGNSVFEAAGGAAAGIAASGFGAGGSGAVSASASTGNLGGAATGGAIFVTEYLAA